MRTSCLAGLVAFLAAAVLLAAPLCLGSALAADATSEDEAVAGHFDYAVPDAPAFQLLEVDAKSILRPGTRRELALILDRADLGGFAIECAPFLLAHDGNIPLSEYKKRRALYTLRISGAASSVGSTGTSAAIGLRWSIFDSSDPYTNPSLVGLALELADSIQDLRRGSLKLLQQDSVFESIRRVIPDEDRNEFDESVKAYGRVIGFLNFEKSKPEAGKEVRAALEGGLVRAAEQKYEAACDRLEDDWNRDLLELGSALSGNTVDTVSRRARLLAYGGWLVGGKRLGSRGQILLGASTRLERNPASGLMEDWQGGAGTRFYYGKNDVKASLEADIAWQRRGRPTYAGDLGAEIRILSSVWVVPAVELSRNELGNPELSAHVSLRFADPGGIPTFQNMRTDTRAETKK